MGRSSDLESAAPAHAASIRVRHKVASAIARRTLVVHGRVGGTGFEPGASSEDLGERLSQVRFRARDVVVLRGERDRMPDALKDLGILPLAERELPIGRIGQRWLPVLVLAAAMGAVVFELAPVAIAFFGASLATRLGHDVDAFLMAVTVGAACDFLTPFGHQCNTLVMGPGGYRFGDYWKLGLPLSLMVVAAGTPLIARVWGLR